jgi:uncharacterized protein (UPF0335 family)
VTGLNTPSGDALLGFVERIERLRETIDEYKDDEKSVFAEAKAAGFNTKAVRHVLKVRKNDRDGKRGAREALQSDIDIYAHALGIEDMPLFRHLEAGAKLSDSAEKLLEHFKSIAPEGGEILFSVGGRQWRVWRDGEGEAHAETYTPPSPGPGGPKKTDRPGVVLAFDSKPEGSA